MGQIVLQVLNLKLSFKAYQFLTPGPEPPASGIMYVLVSGASGVLVDSLYDAYWHQMA